MPPALALAGCQAPRSGPDVGGTFKTESKTAEGIATTFALNTLGAFVLEKELHGALAAAKGRVVNVR